MIINIVTTAGREDYLEKTMQSIHKSGSGYDIVVQKDIVLGLDGNHNATWREAYKQRGQDYGVVVQDDIQVSKNALECIPLIFERTGCDVVSLYSNLAEILTNDGIFEIPARKFLMEQCVSMRKETLAEYLDWMVGKFEPRGKEHDALLSRFFTEKNKRIMCTSPVGVQHIGHISTAGHNWKIGKFTRDSRRFMGEDFDLLAHIL